MASCCRFLRVCFVWKWCALCSRYSRNCARMFRICSCRIRTSSRNPLLEDLPDSPKTSQCPSPRSVASPSCVSNRIDYNVAKTTREVISQRKRNFKFDEPQSNSSSESTESSDDDEHPEEQRSIRKGHPLIPWGLLGLHKTVRPWGSDPNTINKAFHYMISRLNIDNHHVDRNTVPVHGQLNLTSKERLENPFGSKAPCEKRTLPKTNSKQDTSGGSATGHGDLGSLRIEPEPFANLSDSNDTRGSWKKPTSPKSPKLDTSEDTAPVQRDPIRQESVRFPDIFDSKGICTAMVKSISPKTLFKLDTGEGAATGIRRDLQQTRVSNPDSVVKDESDTVPHEKNTTNFSSSNVDVPCSKS